MWNAHLTYQLSRIRISNPVEIAEQGSIEATSQRNKKNEAQELIYSNFTKVINIYAMSALKTTILKKVATSIEKIDTQHESTLMDALIFESRSNSEEPNSAPNRLQERIWGKQKYSSQKSAQILTFANKV